MNSDVLGFFFVEPVNYSADNMLVGSAFVVLAGSFSWCWLRVCICPCLMYA